MKNKESSKTKIWGKGIEDFFSTLPNYKKILIIVLILILILLLLPIKLLTAYNYKTGEYIKSWRIEDRDVFSVEYTHSVELSQVIETYTVKDKNIILTEAYFKSLGAGLPATTPYKFELAKEGFRLYDINEKMDNLIYRTGAERANHKLIINNKIYDFLDFSTGRTAVKLTIEKGTLLSYIIKEGLY